MSPLIVGLGSPDRGDDAVGPLAARALAEMQLPGIEVVAHADPTALLDLMAGREPVVVIDALRSGRAAGTLTVLETGVDLPPLPAPTSTGPAGTHGIGLSAALELARVLERLPRRVVVVGVEGACFDHGASLSPEVSAAVPAAVSAVTDLFPGMD